jgi:hypothetical protein
MEAGATVDENGHYCFAVALWGSRRNRYQDDEHALGLPKTTGLRRSDIWTVLVGKDCVRRKILESLKASTQLTRENCVCSH